MYSPDSPLPHSIHSPQIVLTLRTTFFYTHIIQYFLYVWPQARTEAYQQALEGNPGLLGGASVLDVGCGTGILSMFAARGGAKRVVAVDGSSGMAELAAANCGANGLSSSEGGPVTTIAAKIEDLQLLPPGSGEPQQEGEKVDVLVSEWMGECVSCLETGGGHWPSLERVAA
jgi:methylase of polypeptide subunit release factors